MKIQSSAHLPLTEHYGIDRMKVRVNEVSKTVIDQNGNSIQVYEYDECEISDNPSRSELVEALIALKHTPGAELSLINTFNKGAKINEYTAFLKYVEICKFIADAILGKKQLSNLEIVDYGNNLVHIKPITVTRDSAGELKWVANEYVIVKTERIYNSTKYKCIQPHTTQLDWSPDVTPSLWEVVPTTNNWTAGVAYKVNDIVIYLSNGVLYKCLQAHTAIVSWEPPSVPALWQKQ